MPLRFRNRAFADGGYLNNKPFSYAIEELGVRGGDLPYDRKLVYIEPSPETLIEEGSDAPKPDALENAFEAAFALPRYQTIREDLRRVVERNRLVTRVQDVIEGLEDTVAQSDMLKQFKGESAAQFAGKKLTELSDSRGSLYAGYHWLKIKTVTDELSRTIGKALDLDEASDELHTLYFVVRAWVQSRYDQEGDKKETESRFLLQFDLDYRERRLYALLARLDALYAGGAKSDTIAQSTGIDKLLEKRTEQQKEQWKTAIRALRGKRDGETPVRLQRLVLARVLGGLRRERNELQVRGAANALERAKPDGVAWRTWLRSLLEGTDEECAEKSAKLFSKSPPPELLPLREQLVKMLACIDFALKKAFVCASRQVEELLGHEALPVEFDAGKVLRYCMRKQYDAYDFYDAVSFPILYGTDTGMLKVTAVHRISPRDATSLIDEAKDPKNRTKLAGDTLSAFGAFFQERWRRNDLMWGRLDGAERILNMLLPGKELEARREVLLKQAQGEILLECMHAGDVQNLLISVADTVAKSAPGDAETLLAQKALALPGSDARIRAFVTPERLVDYVRASYAVDKVYRPEWALPVAARQQSSRGTARVPQHGRQWSKVRRRGS